ncbi:hypothetical protein NS2_49370 [Nocardia seriolae NBRC 15557]|nr:hypothetical protein NS2_49370 [Nocardia seriolae NBRC 15557]
MRTMPSIMRLREPSVKVRRLSRSSEDSATMFGRVPACSAPAVRTGDAAVAVWRAVSACRRTTSEAAMSSGSMVVWGWEAWPPLPRKVTRTESEAAMRVPGLLRMMPAGSGLTCCPSTMRGCGNRSSRPSLIMLCAPAPVSSAGWNSATTVPGTGFAASSAQAPSSAVTWTSWPHACMTPGTVEA